MARTRGDGNGEHRIPEGGEQAGMDERENIIARLTELVARQSDQIQQLIQQRNVDGPPVNRPQHRVDQTEIIGERFRKLNPPIFENAVDPIFAEEWLRTTENMFLYSRVPEAEKVLCASFMLRGSAGYWWDTVKVLENVETMTWDKFKELFRNKYFTAPARAAKLNEFIQLKQGPLTVTEYINKFEQLSGFAAHMVSTNALKVERFLEGLRPELYRDVSMAGTQGVAFSQIAERALVAEQAELKIRRAHEARRQNTQKYGQNSTNEKKRSFQFQNQGSGFSQKQGQTQGEQSKRAKVDQGKAQGQRPSCSECGKMHSGTCLKGTRACFICKEEGHIASVCPNRQTFKPQERVPARVFTLTTSEAEENPSVVTGKIYIYGTSAFTLFDSGATHSFASTKYVKRLGREEKKEGRKKEERKKKKKERKKGKPDLR